MLFLGFTDETIKYYTSYLSNGKFIVGIENEYSDKTSITCTAKFNFEFTALFNLYQRRATGCG